MRKAFFFATAIIAFTSLSAQKAFKQTTFYGEIVGNGLSLSVNYERQLKDKPGLGLHIGLGLPGDDEVPVIPIGVKYLFKLRNEKSFIEGGLGVTFLMDDGDDKSFIQRNAELRAAFIPSVGYRHHTSYGLMWRLNYTPVFLNYRSIWYVGGFSIGWRI